jgi:hypothetical protein
MIQSQFKDASLKTDQYSPGLLDNYLKEHSDDPEIIAEGLAIDFMEDVTRLLQEKGISRSGLSDMMNVSRAYVTRLLNSPPNMTLMSVARLSIALNARPYIGLTATEPMDVAIKIADAGLTLEWSGKAISKSVTIGLSNAGDVGITPDRISSMTSGLQFEPRLTKSILASTD